LCERGRNGAEPTIVRSAVHGFALEFVDEGDVQTVLANAFDTHGRGRYPCEELVDFQEL
jgi:hypothetical protein